MVSAAAYSGSFGAQMATTGRIDQLFATTIGQTYYVAARIRINQQLVNPSWGGLRVQIVNASWSQLAVSPSLTITNSPAGQWTRVYFSFVANTTQSRLIYQNFSGGGQFNAAADEFIVSPNPISDDPQATPTPGSSPTPTSPAPTNTPLPPTATPTPTPTGTATPIITSNLMYLSSTTGGTVSGITFADEDILTYNTGTGVWSLYFDGSDVGLGSVDVSSWELMGDGSVLFSVDVPVTLATVGVVDDSDIIRFTPTTTGSSTAGTFSWYFDGSDVGLDLDAEEIDALDVLANGQIIISTTGSFAVTGASGLDEDLIAFAPTSLGDVTAGTWSFYFDGSDVGLANTNSEEITNVWVAGNGDLYLSALGAFTVTDVTGDGADVFRCVPGSLGSVTTCTFNLVWDGSLNGFAGEVLDALVIVQP